MTAPSDLVVTYSCVRTCDDDGTPADFTLGRVRQGPKTVVGRIVKIELTPNEARTLAANLKRWAERRDDEEAAVDDDLRYYPAKSNPSDRYWYVYDRTTGKPVVYVHHATKRAAQRRADEKNESVVPLAESVEEAVASTRLEGLEPSEGLFDGWSGGALS
jgi:hypothetical protein